MMSSFITSIASRSSACPKIVSSLAKKHRVAPLNVLKQVPVWKSHNFAVVSLLAVTIWSSPTNAAHLTQLVWPRNLWYSEKSGRSWDRSVSKTPRPWCQMMHDLSSAQVAIYSWQLDSIKHVIRSVWTPFISFTSSRESGLINQIAPDGLSG